MQPSPLTHCKIYLNNLGWNSGLKGQDIASSELHRPKPPFSFLFVLQFILPALVSVSVMLHPHSISMTSSLAFTENQYDRQLLVQFFTYEMNAQNLGNKLHVQDVTWYDCKPSWYLEGCQEMQPTPSSNLSRVTLDDLFLYKYQYVFVPWSKKSWYLWEYSCSWCEGWTWPPFPVGPMSMEG